MPTNRDLSQELLVGAGVGDFASFHIDVHQLDDLIATHGVGIELRRAIACPCRRIETDGARTGCPHCNGLSWVHPLDLREDTVALVLNRDPRRSFKPSGESVVGQAHATFPLGVHPTQGDLVLPAGEVHVVHETFWRAVIEVDVAAVRDRRGTPDQHTPQLSQRPERLLYDDEQVTVDAVYWIRPSDAKLIRARVGVDVTLRGRDMTWIGEGPPAGVCYTVRYTAPAAYIVAGAEPVFRSEGSSAVGFPYRCPLMRLDRWDEKALA